MAPTLDITEACEAGARAHYAANAIPNSPPWDHLPATLRRNIIASIVPTVAAAAFVIEGQVRQQIGAELSTAGDADITVAEDGTITVVPTDDSGE